MDKRADSYVPSDYIAAPHVREWFERTGFVQSRDSRDNWEIAYAGSMGYGYVTLRFWPHDFGYDAIVETHSGECSVNLGMCRTLRDMAAIWESLKRFDDDNFRHPMQRDDVAPLHTVTPRQSVDAVDPAVGVTTK